MLFLITSSISLRTLRKLLYRFIKLEIVDICTYKVLHTVHANSCCLLKWGFQRTALISYLLWVPNFLLAFSFPSPDPSSIPETQSNEITASHFWLGNKSPKIILSTQIVCHLLLSIHFLVIYLSIICHPSIYPSICLSIWNIHSTLPTYTAKTVQLLVQSMSKALT